MTQIDPAAYLSFLTLSILAILPTFFSFKIGGRAFLPFTIYGLSIFIFLIVGILSFNSRLNEYHPVSHSYITLILFSLFPVYFGSTLAILKNKNIKYETFKNNKSQESHNLFMLNLCIFITAGIIFYCWSYGLPSLWKIILSNKDNLKLSISEIYAMRTAATSADSFSYAKLFFFSLPLVLFISSFYLLSKKSISTTLFILTALFSALLSSAFMHKAALAIYVPAAFSVFIYIKGLDILKATIFGAITCIFLVAGFSFYYQGQPIVRIFELLSFRIFGSYSFNTQFALDIFPNKMEYLWGWSMINPLGIGGGGGNLPEAIMKTAYGAESGNASLSTFGHWYANFGWFGVGLSTLLVTSWLSLLTFIHRMVKKEFILLVLWIYFSVSVLDFARMEFFTAIGLRDLFIALVFSFLYLALKTISRHAK